MEQNKSSITVFRFDIVALEMMLHIFVPPVLVLGILGLAWTFQNEAMSVGAASLLAAAFVYSFEWIGRKKLILSDDTDRIEIAAGEKALLRTLQRLSWDSDRVRAGIAAAGAAAGCAAGFGLIWANIGPVLPTCLAAMASYFSVFFVYMRMDQSLARAYIERGHAAYLAGDLPAAIGDASESHILSLCFRYEAYMIRGLVWMQLGAYDRAVTEFCWALIERPNSAEALAAHEAAARRAVEAEGRNWEEWKEEMDLLMS